MLFYLFTANKMSKLGEQTLYRVVSEEGGFTLVASCPSVKCGQPLSETFSEKIF